VQGSISKPELSHPGTPEYNFLKIGILEDILSTL